MTTAHRDQVTYSIDEVEAMLPGVWDDEFVLSARPAKAAAATGVRSKPDPRRIPDWLLSVADVQVGYRRARLTEQEQSCLRHTVHLGYTPGELAEHWGVASEDIHHACMTGIQRIADYLSGRTPR